MEINDVEEEATTTIRVDRPTHLLLKQLKRKHGVSIKKLIWDALSEKYPDTQPTKA